MKGGRALAYAWFYPAAAAYGAIALPLSMLAMERRTPWLAALADPAGHAHEMLFGFALAVVAGNQLGALSRERLVMLFLLWIGARAAFLLSPASVLADALNAAFPALLAAQVAPRLYASAKKLRNQALPSVIALLCVAGVAWQLAHHWRSAVPATLALATVLLFTLLMLFMGGRIIAPAVAGQFYRQGDSLQARVQPRLEAALIIACGLAVVALFFPEGRLLSAVAAAAAGVLAFVRLARWRLWALRGRADLLCLSCGYAWLAIGLVAMAGSLASGRLQAAAVHVVTVGALGTLTLNVMAMSWALKNRFDPARSPEVPWGTGLIAAAVLCRIAGSFDPNPWLSLAAACWSGAFVLLLAFFWRIRLPL